MSLFLRLLGEEDKGAALEAAVRSVAAGQPYARVFEVDPESFGQVPGERVYVKPRRVLKVAALAPAGYLETQSDVDGYLDRLRKALENAIGAGERIEIR